MWRRALVVSAALGGSFSCRALLLFSPPPPWVVEAEAEVRRTRHAFFDRASELVANLDDRVSDAPSLALALTNACVPEYDAYAKARSVLAGPTDRQRESKRRALDHPKEKSRAALPIVLAHRAGKPLKRRDYTG